ncbi:type VI secretion system-associated protein TagF [Rhodovarius crocodyli]|uniref:Type VI secretion system-associated protein TagF n=1 Tax=Rhodovarius crocodyli TaxID=1979269 RepID=A0A437MMF1_9PROT|nr:type VI secretion system-associated protein TagF [Rhodovarius crocodyli]RVT98813.1 type VI secretion system-associated protein TagF [Rhodovarius crocodyli]
MSGAVGLFGKLPAHGDFVRRNLPRDFIAGWDAWLSEGILALDGALVPDSWRFRLSPGECGAAAVAGVVIPSEDMVGRRFPITFAVALEPDGAGPAEGWFDALEAVPLHGSADEVLALLPAIIPGDACPLGLWRPGQGPHAFAGGYAALAPTDETAAES